MRKIKFTTPKTVGRHEIINDRNSDLNVLNLSVLNLVDEASERIDSGECEVCYAPVIGAVQARIGDKTYPLAVGDCLYVPRYKMTIIEGTGSDARVVICKAKAEEDTEIIYTRFGDAWQAELGHEVHGKYNFTRDVVNLVKRSDKACKIVAGISTGQDGQWTSWPPHHHSETLEEIYYYFDMSSNGFGIQIGMFMDGEEQAEIVRNGDAVIVPNGYHPTVASPGNRMKYIWFLGAKNNSADRRAKVETHPIYL